MAPMSLDDDDFILTISDDEALLSFEEESESSRIGVGSASRASKRKRDEEVSAIDHRGSSKPSKRQKKLKGAKAGSIQKTDRTAAGFAGGNLEETSEEDNDAAIDSDFEFNIGGVDTGVIEDFDGWGMEDRAPESAKQGQKKGVDIDELIARRRARNVDTGKVTRPKALEDAEDHPGEELNAQRAFQGEEGDRSHSSENQAEHEHVNGTNGPNTEEYPSEDELMAPDGFGMGATADEDENDDDDEDQFEDPDSEDESVASPVPHPDDQPPDVLDNDSDNAEEQARRDAFFAPEIITKKLNTAEGSKPNSFQSMSLSRPILRGLASIGFSEPTPIQAKTIPVALLAKDVVGGAVTGSGKTAAFMIPILERLLYRPKKVPTSRVAILMPTRELAVQCFNVARKLASYTDVTFCQLVGGFSLREQESVLRTRPDVIIATPGRFIDHMRNSASFTVDTLEILVLDEADRMLEDGFADELNEILTTIPKSRQTMLFSATMTSSVDKLIRVGLNRPVRLMVDAQRQTVGTLVQEFVRLRLGREDKRLAYLMHLCSTVYTNRCIVFFRQKKEAHRVRVVFGLFGLKAAELHGSMSQEQRISSVESFRSGTATHLLATDVASRGLDIKGVESVINYEAPQSHEIYLHRVGRTARAGRSGRACTIAAEPDRKVVKAAVKAGKAQGAKIVSRAVENSIVDTWTEKLAAAETEVAETLEEEKEERALGQVEMRVRKGENIIEHEAEIMARPRRTWFETEAEKKVAKAKGNVELNGVDRGVKKPLGKLSGKDKKKLDDRRERKEGRMWKKGREERGASGKGKSKGSEKAKGKVKSKGKSKVVSKARGRR